MSFATPNGAQMRLIREAFQQGFNRAELKMFLAEQLDEDLDDLVAEAPFSSQVFQLLQAAQRRGWLEELVGKAIATSKNPAIKALRAIELLSVEDRVKPGDLPEGSLEKLVRARTPFQDLLQWSARLAGIGRAVCRIEDPTRSPAARGTGFLVGPDLVLTNRHVVAGYLDGKAGFDPARLLCRFDHAVIGGDVAAGMEAALATQWCVADRPHSRSDSQGSGAPGPEDLDYALLRLASDIGNAPAPGGGKRGFIPLRNSADWPVKGDLLFIAQHPGGAPLKLGHGEVLEARAEGLERRLRYDANTEGGSSGSPCLNVSLDLVGLHHAGDPLYDGEGLARYNQGIPIRLVADDLAAKGIAF